MRKKRRTGRFLEKVDVKKERFFGKEKLTLKKKAFLTTKFPSTIKIFPLPLLVRHFLHTPIEKRRPSFHRINIRRGVRCGFIFVLGSVASRNRSFDGFKMLIW